MESGSGMGSGSGMALGQRGWEGRGGLCWENRGSGRFRDPSGESGAGPWPRMEKCGGLRSQMRIYGGLGIANANLQGGWDRKCEFTAVWG